MNTPARHVASELRVPVTQQSLLPDEVDQSLRLMARMFVYVYPVIQVAVLLLMGVGRVHWTSLLLLEPQTQAGVVPPHPPAPKLAAVDDPQKPRCKDCGHKQTDHIESVRCLGKLSFDTPCTCKRYRPKEQA